MSDPETATPPVVVLGPGSLIGPALLARLGAAGRPVACFGRAAREQDGVPVLPLDSLSVAPGAVIVSLLPIWLVAPLMPRLAGARQIVAFGSTSLLTKPYSDVGQRLAAAEGDLRRAAENAGIAWTILRPTLIYKPPLDGNVSRLARVLRRYRLAPIAGFARGRRQPVHADDLADGAFAAIGNAAAFGRTFELPGGETLSYCRMVARIFRALGRPPLILPLPMALLRPVLRTYGRIRPGALGIELFDHMALDMAFDPKPAEEVLGWRPRPFRPEFPPGFR